MSDLEWSVWIFLSAFFGSLVGMWWERHSQRKRRQRGGLG
jgi:hypothetical protein